MQGNAPTVMVVDDLSMARETLARLLRKEGYSTVTAASGTEALRLLEEQLPNLILLDVNMPDIDGLELLEKLQAHPQWKSLPVIMLTAVSDTHAVRRAAQLGAKEYLVKAAFSVGDMLAQIRKYTCHEPQ